MMMTFIQIVPGLTLAQKMTVLSFRSPPQQILKQFVHVKTTVSSASSVIHHRLHILQCLI
jgi:hypothetical protein